MEISVTRKKLYFSKKRIVLSQFIHQDLPHLACNRDTFSSPAPFQTCLGSPCGLCELKVVTGFKGPWICLAKTQEPCSAWQFNVQRFIFSSVSTLASKISYTEGWLNELLTFFLFPQDSWSETNTGTLAMSFKLCLEQNDGIQHRGQV